MKKEESWFAIIPFLNQYPLWAQIVLVGCLVSFICVLIFAYPKDSRTAKTSTRQSEGKEAENDFDKITPELQTKPNDIAKQLAITQMQVNVLNCSNYAAKNIFVDVKFGEHPWKYELFKAGNRDMMELLKADAETKKHMEKYCNLPTINELRPGKAVKLFLFDMNKEFLMKQKMSFRSPDGTVTPVLSDETNIYKMSQDWSGELQKIENGKSLRILIRTIWENEIGKKFERISEYMLTCTKVGVGRSYTFIPSGVVVREA